MALFRHPSLNRGIVHTPRGAFEVNRQIVDVSQEIGEALGWAPIEISTGADPAAGAARVVARMKRLDAN